MLARFPRQHVADPDRVAVLYGFLREAAVVAFAMLVYFAVRNVTVGSQGVATANAEWLFRLEQRLHLDDESWLQGPVVAHDTLVTLANWVYIWGHWPVILGTAVVLYLLLPDRYRLLRNAMFASGLIGFAFFALFPVAPPRLLDLGLVDTVTERSSAYRTLQPPGLTNQYAAFPSLHAGWNLLVGIVLLVTFTSLAVRVFAVVMPLAMALAVVVTANHFVIDVLAGWLVVLVGLGVALALERRGGRPSAQMASTLSASGLGVRARQGRHAP